MNIESKTVTTSRTTDTTFTISSLNGSHMTWDDPARRFLRIQLIEVSPPQNIMIEGDEYDSLGQWTDESLCAFLVAKYGLVVAP
jgi:hypothetical protein